MARRNFTAALLAIVFIGMGGMGTPSLVAAATPKVGKQKQADVRKLEIDIRAAIETARSQFTPGETDAEREAAIQAAIMAAIAASGFDAITAQAALSAIVDRANPMSLITQAAEAVLAIVLPEAQQELAAAGAASNGGSGSGSSGSSPPTGGAGGAGGSGGYVVGH